MGEKKEKCAALQREIAALQASGVAAAATGAGFAMLSFGVTSAVGGAVAAGATLASIVKQDELNFLQSKNVSAAFAARKKEELAREIEAEKKAERHIALAEQAEEMRKKAENIENEAERLKKVTEAEVQKEKLLHEARLARAIADAQNKKSQMDLLTQYLIA